MLGGDAQRSGGDHRAAGELVTSRSKSRKDPFPDLLGSVGSEAGKDDDEFLTSITSYAIRIAHDIENDFCGRNQHSVANRMAVRIVDLFETVQIGEQDAERPAAGNRAAKLRVQDLIEMSAIENARQRIASMLILEFRRSRLEVFGHSL